MVQSLFIKLCRRPLLIIFITSGLLVDCSSSVSVTINKSNSDTTSISVKKAYRLIVENANNPNFIILDVRKPDDFEKEHIPKAINIDFKSDNFSRRLDSLDKSKIYIVNCYGGFRSRNTMGIMEKKGFVKIFNMKGGIMKWRAKNYPLVSL